MTSHHSSSILVAVALLGGALVSSSRAAQPSPTLSRVVVNELKVLEETYRLLDAVAPHVWPGWAGYREVPFLLQFENGLRVLVGHPNPPKPFEVVPEVTVAGLAVAADRSRLTAVKVEPYLHGGGGPNNFGVTEKGEPVFTVHISLRAARGEPEEGASAPPTTEEKILMYLHELFHCFARGRIEPRAGNLQFNPDTDFATWSNIEGLALARAYKETDEAAAKQRIKDFLVARSLKRRSMTDDQQHEESADDVREGTATYATLRALEVVRAKGFRPGRTPADDPYYHGFAQVDRMIADFADRLAKAAARHPDPKMKCYEYGCFQCALSERYVPGWQKAVEQGTPVDAVLAERVPVSDAERQAIERRLRSDYPYEEIRASALVFTSGRDGAYRAVTSRQGRVYVLDLKATRQYIDTLVSSKGAFRLGLLILYPTGHPGFTLDQVELSPIAAPANADQLYYLRVVDPQWRSRDSAYRIAGTKQGDGSYFDAVVTTPLFTVKAPRVRVRETATRVKIQVLARVSQ